MRNEHPPDLSLFLDILQTLEAIGAPYMVIGAFAGAVYGVTRTTYDIDIVVDLEDGGYTIYVPSLPGCISEGDTVEDALTNIQEAVELYLEPDIG